MDDFLLRLAKDFGFPALVAAYVLIRLDRRLAHVEHCLVRICAILSATTGVRVEDTEESLLNEPPTVQPVPEEVKVAAGQGKAALPPLVGAALPPQARAALPPQAKAALPPGG